MTTGLERHIERRAACATPRLPKSENFRMRQAWAQMKPPPDDPALFDDHGADHRIWAGRTPALRRKAKG
jgi:hypothetical protein